MTTPTEDSGAKANNRGDNTPHLTTTPIHKISRLGIVSLIKAGLNPAKIAAKYGVSDSTVQYHLSILKKQGVLRKVGYGTWEILKQPEQEKKTTANSTGVGTAQHPQYHSSPRGSPRGSIVVQSELTRFHQDAVRAHAYMFRLQVPRGLRNWTNEKREKYLIKQNIPFLHLNIGGGGQRLIIETRKIWLTNPSIIIYDKASYFAEAALEAKNKAIATHLAIIKKLERMLHASFTIGSDYKFKVARQHYALVYNALAKQYNERGERLEVRTGKGVWFLIDDSYNMNEAETVHPETSMTDNQKVQNFFNGLKKQPITPEFILTTMNGIQQNQMMFAENIESHISAIRDLGKGVRDLNEILGEERRKR